MTVDVLLIKLVVPPALVGLASLAGRRWGQGVGGWIVGLPLTSGPIAVVLALEHGAAFAATAALGSLGGTMAQAAFCLAYGRAGRRAGWPGSLAAGVLGFAAAAALLQGLALGALALAVSTGATLAAVLRLLPARAAVAAPAAPAPRWDLPARMIVTTAIVLLLTAAAPALGPRLSGMLATFPVYAAVLAVFAHRVGAAPAVQVLRGLLFGLFAFAGFFLALALLIERIGVGPAFAAAAAVGLAIQAGSLAFVRAGRRSGAGGRGGGPGGGVSLSRH
jgi:hypothetical protein